MRREQLFDMVYTVVRDIPPGRVTTYGQIALLIGLPRRARAVGQAMFHAPAFLQLPCHRVVNASGRLVPGWEHEQHALLAAEGVSFRPNGCVDLTRCRWNPFEEGAYRMPV